MIAETPSSPISYASPIAKRGEPITPRNLPLASMPGTKELRVPFETRVTQINIQCVFPGMYVGDVDWLIG